MTTPEVCSAWPVELCCDLPEDLDPKVIARWQMVASQLLFRMSGRRWGPSCPIVVRPCRRACLESYLTLAPVWGAAGPWVPYIGVDGQWRNASVCGCRPSGCSCTELCEIKLDGPVYDIVSVQDGEVELPAGAYRVDAPNLLVRTDGGCWAACQDMAASPGADGTLTVTYRTGLPLDESAVAAVSELTCELVKSCLPAGSCGPCRLPSNTTSVIRQGVQIAMSDPNTLFQDGRTGLPLTDMWIRTVNPDGLTSPSRVYSVDYRRPRVMQWP